MAKDDGAWRRNEAMGQLKSKGIEHANERPVRKTLGDRFPFDAIGALLMLAFLIGVPLLAYYYL